MKKFGKIAALGVGALAIAAGASSASAAVITVSSTVPHNQFSGDTLAVTPLATYDFTGQNYAQMTSIDTISITFTVVDGETDLGGIDHNNWHLALDGIDTGMVLNGFPGNQGILAITFTNPNNQAALLAALQADGQLNATILDLDLATPNFITLSSAVDTTLDLTGNLRDGGGGGPQPIPLPAAALLAPLGAGLAGAYRRRFRKSK
jgi:hypothetical protein